LAEHSKNGQLYDFAKAAPSSKLTMR
jgi:hypothetical protein